MNPMLRPCQIDLCMHINHATSVKPLPVCELLYQLDSAYTWVMFMLHQIAHLYDLRCISLTSTHVHGHATWYLLSDYLLLIHMWMSYHVSHCLYTAMILLLTLFLPLFMFTIPFYLLILNKAWREHSLMEVSSSIFVRTLMCLSSLWFFLFFFSRREGRPSFIWRLKSEKERDVLGTLMHHHLFLSFLLLFLLKGSFKFPFNSPFFNFSLSYATETSLQRLGWLSLR